MDYHSIGQYFCIDKNPSLRGYQEEFLSRREFS